MLSSVNEKGIPSVRVVGFWKMPAEGPRDVPVEGRKVVLVIQSNVGAYNEGAQTREEKQQGMKGKRIKPSLPKAPEPLRRWFASWHE